MSSARAIVVSGIGKRNALLALLGAECAVRGIDVVGCDAIEWPPARIAVTEFKRVPPAREPSFALAYADMLKRSAASAFLTLIDPEIVPLGEMEVAGATEGALFLHPVSTTARICEDKYRFFEVMKDAGISTIPTFLGPPEVGPFIRKDRSGSAGSGFQIYQVSPGPDALGSQIEAGRYVYQPFCHGRHHCVDAYFSIRDGALRGFCAKEVLVKSNGESYLLESVDRERFRPIIEAIAEVLPMRGIVNFDIYDDDGVLAVMEVNCRIGGNYPASHAFGCNLLAQLLDESFEGVAASMNTDVRAGQKVAKYFAFSPPFDSDGRGPSSAHTP